MSEIVGGIRQRLIRDSLYYLIEDALAELGWLTSATGRMDVRFLPEPVDNDQPIELNTLVLVDTDLRETELELGSTGVFTRSTWYVDFYAEGNQVGRHLINDVRDILGGRMSSIGRGNSTVPVYDYRLATPVQVFVVDIEDVSIDRAHGFPKPWQKHWYTCRFDVVDAYVDDSE